jgi:hypothetical protein
MEKPEEKQHNRRREEGKCGIIRVEKTGSFCSFYLAEMIT